MAEKVIRNTYTTYTGPDDLFTEAEQIEQCCEEVDVDICADVGKTEIYTSAPIADFEEKIDEIRSKYGNIRNVYVETIGPNGPCGERHTTWVANKVCCEDVTPLTWNFDDSVEVLTDNSSGVVAVLGGRSPYRWKLRGSGFFVDAGKTRREAVTETDYLVVFTSDACGACTIEVTDGCSTTTGQVASTDGYWDYVYYSSMGAEGDNQGNGPFPGGCPVLFGAESPADSFNSDTFEDQSPGWKIRQTFFRRSNRQYAADPSYDYIMSVCENLGDLCGDKDPLQLSGACFSFEGYANCENSGIGNGGYLSYDVGNQKAVYLPGTSFWYMDSGCSYVSGTQIWKWKC